MSSEKLSLVIAPKRQILKDFQLNRKPILIALGGLIGYIFLSSGIIAVFEPWSFLRAAYFTVINVTTVGFGDITAHTVFGKILSGVNGFVGLVAFGVLVALIVLAFQPSEFTGTARPSSERALAQSESEEEPVADIMNGLARILRDNSVHPEKPVQITVTEGEKYQVHLSVEILLHRKNST